MAHDHLLLVKVAREVAINHAPLNVLLDRFGLDEAQWNEITEDTRFRQLLREEVEAWHSATNTHERVKLKAAAMVEESLPEWFQRMHDPHENLNHKVELAKTVARLAGMGMTNASVEEGAGKFSVTINLGADNKLAFEKEVTPRVIEHRGENE